MPNVHMKLSGPSTTPSIKQPLKTFVCTICSSSYMAVAVNSKYCSRKCKNTKRRSSYKKLEPPYARSAKQHTCIVCKLEFTSTGTKVRYCSKVCRDRRDNLKRLFGITPDEYNKLAIKQHNRCAICGIHQLELNIRLSVDHDHTTNTIRELLCGRCNAALGLVKESTDILHSMIKYIDKWSSN